SSNTLFQNSLTLGVNYILYDFGSRDKKIQLQKDEFLIKKFSLCEKKVEIFKKILDAYKNALVSHLDIAQYTQILSFKKILYKSKQRLFVAGEISKSDVANEAIAIIELENSLRNSEKEYDKALLELSKLSYIKINKNDVLKSFDESQKLPKQMSFEDSLKAKIIDKQIEKKKKELSLLKNASKPVVTLYSSYSAYGSDANSIQTSIDDIKSNSYKVGISFKINLFDGYASKYKSAKALLEIEKFKIQKKLLRVEFETKKRLLRNKLAYSSKITKQNLVQIEDLTRLDKMQKRLRKVKKLDLLKYINHKISMIEKRIKIKTQNIQKVYDKETIKLQNTGISQCIQP
ncbi:MAG: TolC family protein, partial [Campylobacteraceae bacterium]|nr:TolC family protein [Campylobacteraceae bacterium]